MVPIIAAFRKNVLVKNRKLLVIYMLAGWNLVQIPEIAIEMPAPGEDRIRLVKKSQLKRRLVFEQKTRFRFSNVLHDNLKWPLTL